MRTVSFKSVYDAILQRLGLDPTADAITHDTARSIAKHITKRAADVWTMWDWPELTVTQERGFRAPWYFSVQYHALDEVYYVANKKYYKVKGTATPPLGTVPTDTVYWDPLEAPSTYVARDQLGQPPVGKVIGVYKSDPSLNGSAPHDICLKFRPTEAGIYLCYAPLPSVFICHTIPAPTYTLMPWIVGKVYIPGIYVYWPGLEPPYPPDAPGFGECFVNLLATSQFNPTAPNYWRKQPVPDFMAAYLEAGAAADCLKESWASGEDQVRMVRAAAWEAEAKGLIEGVIDDLLAQGQKHYYIKPYWSDGWCLSEPWLGSTVVPLKPEFIPAGDEPQPVPPQTPGMIYIPEIVSLIGPALPSLQGTAATPFPIDTLIKITIDTQEQSWRVDPGPKDVDDPGQISPVDYDMVSNNKHYTKVL